MTETEMKIESQIARIDHLISLQLNEILHHPEFKELEAAWRGLHYLLDQSKPAHGERERVKIRILNVNKNDLLKDFDEIVEFDQSTLFGKVYEEEFGTWGGSPYGVLIGVYEFSAHSSDISLLYQISKVAAYAQAPFISAVSPAMFGRDTFREMVEAGDVREIFDRPQYTKWHNFQEVDSAYYIGLCLPHILLRDPYHLNKRFDFQESAGKEELLWGNAAFAFGACLARAYREKSWLGKMSGVDDDGVVEGLYFQTSGAEDEINDEFSLDAAIDSWAQDLSNLGFMPLIEMMTDKSDRNPYFFSSPSVHKWKKYYSKDSEIYFSHRARLEYTFAACRIAHYLMCRSRDMIGAFMSRSESEKYFGGLISRFVLDSDNATEEEKARRPFGEGRLWVQEIPGRPGLYKAILRVVPKYLLEERNITVLLEVNLPVPAIGIHA